MKNIDMLRFYSTRIAPTINSMDTTDLIELSLAHRDFKAATKEFNTGNEVIQCLNQ